MAWALRLPPLLSSPLHPDEAVYGYWGLLIGRGRDPWLATIPVDKPPLLAYLGAGSQALFGDRGFSVRLLGLAAGLTTVPLVAAMTRVLYHDRWTTGAVAVGVSLSPFALAFSATGFPDPVMAALGIATCTAAVYGRPSLAGLLAGSSFATKQTGLMWLPLAVLLQILAFGSEGSGIGSLFLIIGGWALVAGLVFGWDAVRLAQGASGFWGAGVVRYGGLRLIWPEELWRRLGEWIGLARYIFVSPIINGVLVVGLPALAWTALTCRRRTREGLADLLLISFSLFYLLFHWLVAFPVWDRYLLPLAPVLSVLLGRVVGLIASRLPRVVRRSFPVPRPLWLVICHSSLIVCLIPPALDAALARYPIGANRAAYDGIKQVAAFLSDLPPGSVVYHHWLGRHYRYYLFDEPLYLAYWPTVAWLTRDVEAFADRGPRYLAFPSRESPRRVEWALERQGYGLDPVSTATRRDGTISFTVYRLENLDARLPTSR